MSELNRFKICDVPKQFIYYMLQKYYVDISKHLEFMESMRARALIKKHFEEYIIDHYNIRDNVHYLFLNWDKIEWKKINISVGYLTFNYNGDDINE